MKIPIVFAFDDNYALPASIAIKSLIDSKDVNTDYEVIVFHGGLKEKTMRKMEQICAIKWVLISKDSFKDVPQGWSGLETYYRLLMADLLPMYDKVIWSDVDVLFKGDLTEIFSEDLEDYDWAGIPAETQDEKNGIHTHFEENKKPYIYMPGFMIANTKLWREKNLVTRFFKTIDTYGNKLKMFDLDILNLSADKIKTIPFEYCVLENIFDENNIENAPEFPWLSHVHSKECLEKAKKNPIIIHYAGRSVKIWNRKKEEIPEYYWNYINKSPFFDKKLYPSKFEIPIYLLTSKLHPIKAIRHKYREIINNYFSSK